jgi:hypothetical protein
MLMNRVWGHVLAGLAVLAGVAAVSPACVHNDSTIFIREVVAPQFAHPGMACVFTPDPAQAFSWSGLLDVSLANGYNAVYLVGNQMLATVNANQLQTETSTVTIQGAIVRITSADGHELDRYTRLTSATISPSTGSTPGYATVSATIIDVRRILSGSAAVQNVIASPLGQSGFARLVTYVRVFGQTLGGQSVESNEFEYPVDVCNGCLISFTNNPNYPTPNCVGNAAAGTATSQTQIPCYPGQDLAIDCNACQGDPACQGAYQPAPAAPDAGSG